VSYAGPDGRLRTLPVEWTNVLEPDLVVTVGAGRALFRTDLLRELRRLVDEYLRQTAVPSC
jgi:SAM-dependent MidA family methyltransferase